MTTPFAIALPTFVVLTVTGMGIPDVSVATSGVIETPRRVGTTPRFACTLSRLFESTGSTVPAGGVAVAVFAIVAGAAWSTVPMTENTTCPPILTSTSWSIEPVPAKLPQRPSTAEQVHETRSSWAETASRTRAPATSSGPLFVTVTVKASLLPGTNVELETVFVTTRSALAVMSVVTVEVLFVELGSGVVDVTAAALTTEVPPRLAVPTTVTAAAPLTRLARVHVTTFAAAGRTIRYRSPRHT